MADDPQLHPGAARRERAPGAYLRLALWQRFALAGLIAVVLLVAMVIFIDHNNTNSNPSLNETAEVRANREAEILVRQDQAPHTVRLVSGLAPAAALERVLHARMASQIAPRRDRRAAQGRQVQGARHGEQWSPAILVHDRGRTGHLSVRRRGGRLGAAAHLLQARSAADPIGQRSPQRPLRLADS